MMTRLANFPPSKVTLVCSHDATSCSFLNHVTSGVGSPHTVQVRLRDWRGVRGQEVNTWSHDLQLCLDNVIREQVRVSGHPAHRCYTRYPSYSWVDRPTCDVTTGWIVKGLVMEDQDHHQSTGPEYEQTRRETLTLCSMMVTTSGRPPTTLPRSETREENHEEPSQHLLCVEE